MLVLPESQHAGLVRARLIGDQEDPDIWVVREPDWTVRAFDFLGSWGLAPLVSPLRTRIVAPRFHALWQRVKEDRGAVMHVGLPCSPLVPPDMPLVYECMDSTLADLGRGHYRRATRRRCVVNCQTGRISDGLRERWRGHATRWEIEVSPCYFAKYPSTEVVNVVRRDPRSIAFVGRLSPEKSPMLFLQALAILRQRGMAFRATILGTGPMLSAMRSRITEDGLSDCVSVGFHPDVSAVVLEAAIFVSLQTGDNYGSQSLLEAMGAGCAVVASDVGETWRLVDSAVGCRVPLNPVAIADAVGTLIESHAATKRLGDEALRRVRTSYTEDNYARFLEGLYERALDLHQSRQRS